MGRRTIVACVALVMLLLPAGADAGPGDVIDPGRTLPNIVPDVRDVSIQRDFFFDEATGTFMFGPPRLHFDTWVLNLGTVPLQLTLAGAPDTTSTPVAQCVSWTDRICRAQEPVGGFAWHDEHQHWHFQEFAAYELRRLRRNGRLDTTRRGLVGTSDKVSFCMMDSAPERADAFPVGFYQTCSPAMQGVSAGWSDFYGGGLPGQQISLEGASDGRYALTVRMDYADRLYESDETDNVVEVVVELSGGLTEARIVG